MEIKYKIIDEVIKNKYALVNCKTDEEFRHFINIATKQNLIKFSKFSIDRWSSYKEKTCISITNNSYGPIETYIHGSNKKPSIYLCANIIKDSKNNPEYFL